MIRVFFRMARLEVRWHTLIAAPLRTFFIVIVHAKSNGSLCKGSSSPTSSQHNSSRDYIASSFQSYEGTTLLKPLSSALFLKAASLMTIYHEI